VASLLAQIGQTISRIRAESPIPYVGSSPGLSWPGQRGKSDPAGQMAQYGSVGTLFAIVSMEATATAKAEWHLYRKAASGKDEDRVEVTVHPALSVLTKPNEFYSRQELFETGQQHVDLAGIAFWVVARDPRFASIPLELWPVRPDKMMPVTDPKQFLLGWIYNGPNGEKVPLDRKDVLVCRMPDPENPYMGLGPVQSIKTDAEAKRYIAEWNRNFFRNSAEPGGIIEFDTMLDDTEFLTLQKRWAEQHRGVSNAHRVAILEKGRWVERKYTQRDMEFSTLNRVSSDVIREAFAFPAFMLGQVVDVNRASADASERFFAKYHTVSRLDRWKGLLNNDFLSLFGTMGVGYEFDYESPVDVDNEIENQSRDSKVKAAVALVVAGFDADEVLEAMGLPAITWTKPAAPTPPPGGDPNADPNAVEPGSGAATDHRVGRVLATLVRQLAAGDEHWHDDAGGADRRGRLVLNAAKHPGSDIDLSGVQSDWQGRLTALLNSWGDVTQHQRDEIRTQVIMAVDSNDLSALGHLSVSTAEGYQLLAIAMSAIAQDGATWAVLEARKQGQSVGRGHADESILADSAALVVVLLAQALTNAAAREALRNYARTSRGADVADAVDAHLGSLSDAFLRDNLGGALSRAQMAGMMATYRQAPEASLYSSEILDTHICPECSKVAGKFLGLSTDTSQVDLTYPNGQYVHCLGGLRCRGQVVAVWRTDTTPEGGDQ
jgi:HK97 family phage portal protein